jgi:hypothetical protein
MPDRANFQASTNGLAFTNSFPHEPAVVLHTPLGDINVGDAGKGLCGGMAFAAMDYWNADLIAPTERPDQGTPLYNFLVKRIVDSWHVPAGVLQYFQWMNLPDADENYEFLGRPIATERGLASRTITQQWPLIQSDLDAGVPSPLGLVTVKSHNVQDIGVNHQVVAYGYSVDGADVTINVYDPNSGQDDGVAIAFDTSAPTKETAFTNNINMSHPLRGFFRTAYAPVSPPA